MGVGPNQGDMGWWSNNEADVTLRACLFDDIYAFNADGSFQNIQGADTWLEGWQGATDAERLLLLTTDLLLLHGLLTVLA